jgi:hypothetical protein
MRILGFLIAIGLSSPLGAAPRAEPPPLPRPSELAPPMKAEDRTEPRAEPSDALCGVPGLRGESLPAITAEGGCGVAAPIRLEAVDGVALEPPAVMACDTARALLVWMKGTVTESFAAKGADPSALVIADSYSCRNRNRAASGKLSEHARGNAIDISGFRVGDDHLVTVLDGWNSPEWGETLRRLRAGGCGPFGTVLGPGSNALHADHFHFDVAARRSGPWCE